MLMHTQIKRLTFLKRREVEFVWKLASDYAYWREHLVPNLLKLRNL